MHGLPGEHFDSQQVVELIQRLVLEDLLLKVLFAILPVEVARQQAFEEVRGEDELHLDFCEHKVCSGEAAGGYLVFFDSLLEREILGLFIFLSLGLEAQCLLGQRSEKGLDHDEVVSVSDCDALECRRLQLRCLLEEGVEPLADDEEADLGVLVSEHEDQGAHDYQVALVIAGAQEKEVASQIRNRHERDQRGEGFHSSHPDLLLLVHVHKLSDALCYITHLALSGVEVIRLSDVVPHS